MIIVRRTLLACLTLVKRKPARITKVVPCQLSVRAQLVDPTTVLRYREACTLAAKRAGQRLCPAASTTSLFAS